MRAGEILSVHCKRAGEGPVIVRGLKNGLCIV